MSPIKLPHCTACGYYLRLRLLSDGMINSVCVNPKCEIGKSNNNEESCRGKEEAETTQANP